MTKMQNSQNEIEIKHPLHNPQHVMLRLKELGATLIANSEFQEDTYYVPAHRNFLDEPIVSEWLRIRRTLHTTTINYKRWLPIGAEIQTHCDEYESAVANASALEQILHALDMREIVKVSKNRSVWRLKDVEVAINQVE